MTEAGTKIDILLCTFRRPDVTATLRSLDAQELPESVDLRIVVSDNDDLPSAQAAVTEIAAGMAIPVEYQHAPARNISIARNAGLDAASGRGADWVTFLDDDEIAAIDWLAQLQRCANAYGVDAVFGPSLAQYGPDTPEWMRRQDHHSNRPGRRGETVETGHTCNALLRWGDAPWTAERFDPARGRAGGEDTEFFFRLHRMGARFEICETAIVREAVPPNRLSFRWILSRKYRSGQSYAAVAGGKAADRFALALQAAVKVLVCVGGGAVYVWSEERRNFWLLRGAMHVGVISGCLALRQPELYGSAAEG